MISLPCLCCGIVQYNERIETLNLSRSGLGPNGTILLAEYLASNYLPQLTSLDVSHCRIGEPLANTSAYAAAHQQQGKLAWSVLRCSFRC